MITAVLICAAAIPAPACQAGFASAIAAGMAIAFAPAALAAISADPSPRLSRMSSNTAILPPTSSATAASSTPPRRIRLARATADNHPLHHELLDARPAHLAKLLGIVEAGVLCAGLAKLRLNGDVAGRAEFRHAARKPDVFLKRQFGSVDHNGRIPRAHALRGQRKSFTRGDGVFVPNTRVEHAIYKSIDDILQEDCSVEDALKRLTGTINQLSEDA